MMGDTSTLREALFSPRVVALVGASADAAKVKQRGKGTNAPSAEWSKFIRIESMTKGPKAKGLKSKK